MVEIHAIYSIIQETLEEQTSLQQPLDSRPINPNPLNQSTQEKFDVCPEEYSQNRFHAVPCNKLPFNEVVSFVFLLPNCQIAQRIVKAISQIYKHVELIIGIESYDHGSCGKIIASYNRSFKLFEILPRSVTNSGSTWRQLIEKSTTKYVLVGRDTYMFTDQADVERLLRIMSITGVQAVAGSRRNEDGRWSAGCYQMSLKNYTLRLVEGYDLSYKSCMYCDYVTSSFLAKRDEAIRTLSPNLSSNALFMDYFLKHFLSDRIAAMSCPDVMFSTIENDVSAVSRPLWLSVAQLWKLNRIVLPNSKEIWFDCEEALIKCTEFMEKAPGEVMPPCCLKTLSTNLLRLSEYFANNSMHIECSQGTLLGAVKGFSTLPWEIDGDMNVNYRDSHKAKKLLEEFTSKYKLILSGFNHEKQLIYFTNWFIEVYYAHLNAAQERAVFPVATKVLFNGVWINAPTNPVLHLRKEFGDDIFQHIEHWRPLLNNRYDPKYTNIQRGRFLPCKTTDFHACLQRNYLPEGNIQFMEQLL